MRKNLISLYINTIPFEKFLEGICSLAYQRKSSYVCVANVHMCIEAYDDPAYAHIVNQADYVTPDGMPLVKALQWMYHVPQERVAGMDLLPALLKKAEEEHLKVFFYGGTAALQKATEEYLHSHYPTLHAVGFYSPPFRPLTPSEEEEVITRINASEAQLVMVALGCPKQEKWMANMKGRIHACMLGIGGALPVLVGQQKRAPKWMQNMSLEWLFRLFQEPKRLFKRYAYTNSKFIFLFLYQRLLKN